MADRSSIEWTDATWNPIRAISIATGKTGWHCEHVSEGCRNCYAEAMNLFRGTRLDYKPSFFHGGDVTVFVDEKTLTQPLRWTRPRMIFVCSMTDLFAYFVTDAMLDRIFAVMALCPQHTFQVLTKRPDRMRNYVAKRTDSFVLALSAAITSAGLQKWADAPGRTTPTWPLRNVWLGTSCEDQATADARIPDLLATPAVVRFASAEPLLGPIEFLEADIYAFGESTVFLPKRANAPTPDIRLSPDATLGGVVQALGGYIQDQPGGLSWVIVGGESGPYARPMHPDWARSIRDQCSVADVPFFFKQWGSQKIGEYQESVSSSIRWQSGGSEFYGEHEDIKYADHWLDHDKDGRLVIAYPASKASAGRRLDDVEHNGMPSMAREHADAP